MALVKSFLAVSRVQMTSPLITDERNKNNKRPQVRCLANQQAEWSDHALDPNPSQKLMFVLQVCVLGKCLEVSVMIWGMLLGGFGTWHKLAVERSANSVLCWSHKLVVLKRREPLQHLRSLDKAAWFDPTNWCLEPLKLSVTLVGLLVHVFQL